LSPADLAANSFPQAEGQPSNNGMGHPHT